jgi:hypothetical protein
MEKQVDKTAKSKLWRSAALSVLAAKSKLPRVAIHGAFLIVEGSWTLTDMKTSTLKRAQRPSTPRKGCSRGEGPGVDLRIYVSFAR